MPAMQFTFPVGRTRDFLAIPEAAIAICPGSKPECFQMVPLGCTKLLQYLY